MIKYLVAALMFVGVSLSVSAQAAQISPSTVQAQAVASEDAVQKVQHWRWGSHGRYRHWRWGSGRRWGWHGRWRSHYRWGSGRRW